METSCTKLKELHKGWHGKDVLEVGYRRTSMSFLFLSLPASVFLSRSLSRSLSASFLSRSDMVLKDRAARIWD